MKNRDIYQKDPDQITLLNSGVAGRERRPDR